MGRSGAEVTIAKVDIAALLALVATLISGVGDVIRQRSAQEVTDEEVWSDNRRAARAENKRRQSG